VDTIRNGMVCVVPARMASTRFPGKPLVDIDGIPLVVRSAQRGRDAGCFERVVVATEDREIASVARVHGFEALLTPSFETGTDRVAWAGRELGARFVVNLQGDEPLFPLDLLRDLARLVPKDPDALWTAADLGLTEGDREDEDVVKIVLEDSPLVEGNRDQRGATSLLVPLVSSSLNQREGAGLDQRERRALDFHRILPPDIEGELAVHVGVYAGSVALLGRFAALPQAPLERERRIEPLRALAPGIAVRALVGRWDRAAVDRKEHISRVLDVLRRGE
jgi:3-deoxy-manno-octulosonate cytidylyltransferase (CMP-KDO synthetase)